MSFIESREVTAVSSTRTKNFNVDMQIDIYESSCCKLGLMIDEVEFHILILVYVTLIMNQDHRDAKGKTFSAVTSQSSQSVWMEFDILLRLVV